MRLNRFSVFNINTDKKSHNNYFNTKLNHEIFEKVTKKCYLPTNNSLIKFNNFFKITIQYLIIGNLKLIFIYS